MMVLDTDHLNRGCEERGPAPMPLQLDATFEDGVLKFDKVPPLKEPERVTVSIQPKTSRAYQSYGMIGWTGDPQVLREIAESDESDESGVQESP